MNATVGNSNVTLGWDFPSSDGTPLLFFSIVRTDSGTGTVTSINATSTDARYVDTTVIPGHEYVYTVTAFNAAGSTKAEQVTVHAQRTVTLKLLIVPFQRSISISGTVTDLSGQGIGGQQVTIYRRSSITGDWSEIMQLTTSPSGKFSSLLSSGTGIVSLRSVLSDDGTHVPITIDQTVGSLKLKNGDLASITSNSTMSEITVSSTADLITFILEHPGTANISIPKDSIANLDLVGVYIDGKQGNYQVTETNDQYIFSLNNVKAGQIISMSLGQPTAENTLPILIGITLLIGACIGTVVIWRGRRKRQV
jgi:hypothetical protein